MSKNANAVIKLKEYGLRHIGGGKGEKVMGLVGMAGKEAIGGQLHLTNYRLIFKSHAINRVTGKFSIFLPTIEEVKDVSSFLTKKIEVVTQTQRFEFVVWGIPKFIAAIKSAKDRISYQEKATITAIVASDYEKCGDGLKVFSPLRVRASGPQNANRKTIPVSQKLLLREGQ